MNLKDKTKTYNRICYTEGCKEQAGTRMCFTDDSVEYYCLEHSREKAKKELTTVLYPDLYIKKLESNIKVAQLEIEELKKQLEAVRKVKTFKSP